MNKKELKAEYDKLDKMVDTLVSAVYKSPREELLALAVKEDNVVLMYLLMEDGNGVACDSVRDVANFEVTGE